MQRTEGATAADISGIVTEAARRAIRSDRAMDGEMFDQLVKQ